MRMEISKGARVHRWVALANLLAVGLAVAMLATGGGNRWAVIAACCVGSGLLAWRRR